MTRTPRQTSLAAGPVAGLAALLVLVAPVLAAAQSNDGERAEDRVPQQAENSEDKPPKFYEHVAEGRKAFGNKDYARALEQFEQAYAIQKTPNLLFNMGLVNERMGRLSEALRHYEKFVVSPGVSLDSRQKAQERIDVLQPIVENRRDSGNETDRQVETNAGAPSEGAQSADASDPSPSSTSGQTDAGGRDTSAGSSGRTTASIALLAAGGGSLIAGGVFYGASRKAETRFSDASSTTARRQARDAAYGRMWAADGFLLAGIGLAATGTVLLLTRSKPDAGDAPRADAPSAVLTPLLGPRRAGIGLSGSF